MILWLASISPQSLRVTFYKLVKQDGSASGFQTSFLGEFNISYFKCHQNFDHEFVGPPGTNYDQSMVKVIAHVWR